MKSSPLATRVTHATKKHFVDTAAALGMTVGEYVAYYIEEALENQQKTALLQQEKTTLEQKIQQMQKALEQAQQKQTIKSKRQQRIDVIMEKNDKILEQNFLQNKHVLTKEALLQQGFHFGFSTCCGSNARGSTVHCVYNYGYTLEQQQVTIYPLENS